MSALNIARNSKFKWLVVTNKIFSHSEINFEPIENPYLLKQCWRMSEFIIIQDRGNIIVGQCGNQIGGQFWNLALQEYGVLNVSDASSSFAERQSRVFRKDFHSFKGGTHHESFFWNHGFSDLVSSGHQGERKEKKIKAKAVLVDMEDGVVSQLLNSKYGHLFDKELKLTYFPGSGNNWAVGHKMHGKHFHETLSCIISRAVEKCDHLQGFILLCSLGGGTGSGLGSYILKILEENFSNVERFVGCVYPEENDDVITSPYNVLFATRELTEHATCVFPFDNKALINICNKISQQVTIRKPVTTNLIPNDLPSTSKPFQDMNSIIANMLLHLTCSARFPGSLNLDINEIYSNMVPFSKMHYISSGLSPLFNLNYNTSKANRQDEIFTSCWSRQNQLCRSIDPMNSTLLAVSLIGRGSITMSEMRKNIERLQTKAKFAPWSTESMKVGLCSVPITSIPSSLLCLFNSTGITNLFTDTLKKFSKLYHRKAHLHHYLVEGMEMADIAECQASMQEVIDLYRGVNTILPDDVISSLKIW